jgi:hypothetical protein
VKVDASAVSLSAGSLGVVDLLCNGLADLYARSEDREILHLVGTEHDPSTNEPKQVQLLTPPYRVVDAA